MASHKGTEITEKALCPSVIFAALRDILFMASHKGTEKSFAALCDILFMASQTADER